MDKSKEVEKIIVYIDHGSGKEWDSGVGMISHIGIVTKDGEETTDDFDGCDFSLIRDEGVISWAKSAGYSVDPNTLVVIE